MIGADFRITRPIMAIGVYSFVYPIVLMVAAEMKLTEVTVGLALFAIVAWAACLIWFAKNYAREP